MESQKPKLSGVPVAQKDGLVFQLGQDAFCILPTRQLRMVRIMGRFLHDYGRENQCVMVSVKEGDELGLFQLPESELFLSPRDCMQALLTQYENSVQSY